MTTHPEPSIGRSLANHPAKFEGTDNAIVPCEDWAYYGAACSANAAAQASGHFACSSTAFGPPIPGMASLETQDDLDIDFDALLREEMELAFGLGEFRYGTNIDYSPDTPAHPYRDVNLFHPLLFSGAESTLMGLDVAPLGHSPASIMQTSDAFARPSDDAFSSSPSNGWSPFSTISPTSTTANELEIAHTSHHCRADGCTKAFRKESQLKQHQRVHKKALVCAVCRTERRTEHRFAQVRDLERHLQARHPDAADRASVRSETRECPFPGCGHRGRRDNVSRHYESKHGGKLKWRKGVPTVANQSGRRQDF